MQNTINDKDISNVRFHGKFQYHLFKDGSTLLGRFSTMAQVQRFARVLDSTTIEVFHVTGETRTLLEVLNATSST